MNIALNCLYHFRCYKHTEMFNLNCSFKQFSHSQLRCVEHPFLFSFKIIFFRFIQIILARLTWPLDNNDDLESTIISTPSPKICAFWIFFLFNKLVNIFEIDHANYLINNNNKKIFTSWRCQVCCYMWCTTIWMDWCCTC